MPPPSKTCVICGRTMEWRKKWARTWADVKYCSDACRRRKLTEVDRELERAIDRLLTQRAAGATICPSDAAREVGGADEEQWRPLMESTRQAARRMVARGEVVITQRGHVVDSSTAKGSIRIRRVGG